MNKEGLNNEHELMALIAEGNEQAFARLFDHYRTFIYSFVLRITGDSFIAAEIVQDTFLKVWLKRQELPNIKNIPGWIYTIAERFTYTALSKSNREKSYFDEWLSEAEYKDEDGNLHLENIDYQAVLTAAVNRLSPKQKETYHLIKEQGLQRAAAAKLLNVSPETVKWNLEKAMSSVREYCLSRLKDPLMKAVFFIFCKIYF